jgi:hypothetical protein
MRRPAALLNIAVVVSSLLLAAGAIAYNAGAFDWFLGSGRARSEPTMMPSSKSVKGVIATPAPAPEGTENSKTTQRRHGQRP